MDSDDVLTTPTGATVWNFNDGNLSSNPFDCNSMITDKNLNDLIVQWSYSG
jgi:hypothetical protein